MASQALSPDQSLGRLLQEIGLEGLLTIGAPVGGEGDWTTITLEQLDDKIIHSAMGNFPLHRWFDGLGHAPVVFLEKDGTRLHLRSACFRSGELMIEVITDLLSGERTTDHLSVAVLRARIQSAGGATPWTPAPKQRTPTAERKEA